MERYFLHTRPPWLNSMIVTAARYMIIKAKIELIKKHSRSQSCDPLGQRLGSRALAGSNPLSPLIGQMGTQ